MPNLPRQAAIYWFDPEPTKGAEIRKIRPCVVVSPNEMNAVLKTVIIAPLTSTIQLWPFRLTVTVLNQKSSVACDQIRAVDKSRLRAYIGDLRSKDREELLNLLQTIFSN
ncbi:MAG TPA: type II toxin-antitoxin system PemK/MazF family toxin [Candidatus Saccharimonadales bacterium]|nr:type II toxin-antitoxin system PemK/MazF family toxin [Candidatus Saccharimonadales bacterium]